MYWLAKRYGTIFAVTLIGVYSSDIIRLIACTVCTGVGQDVPHSSRIHLYNCS